jgi:hypothetical protein
LSLQDAKDFATIVGVAVALATLIKALIEYHRSLVLRRVEHFAKLRDEFLKDESLARITELLERNDARLSEVSTREKWRYLSFFEQVALLVRARLIREELAGYMFGYYALLCDRSESFWSVSFPKNRAYWPLFFDFVEHMRKVEELKRTNRHAFVARLRS